MQATPTTASAAYSAAVAALHAAEDALRDAARSGDKAATWSAELALMRAEDAANRARLDVLDAHAKQALADLEVAVGCRALVAHAIFVQTGEFHGDFGAFMQHIAGMLTSEAKSVEAAAALPASVLPHGSNLLNESRRATLRQAERNAVIA